MPSSNSRPHAQRRILKIDPRLCYIQPWRSDSTPPADDDSIAATEEPAVRLTAALFGKTTAVSSTNLGILDTLGGRKRASFKLDRDATELSRAQKRRESTVSNAAEEVEGANSHGGKNKTARKGMRKVRKGKRKASEMEDSDHDSDDGIVDTEDEDGECVGGEDYLLVAGLSNLQRSKRAKN